MSNFICSYLLIQTSYMCSNDSPGPGYIHIYAYFWNRWNINDYMVFWSCGKISNLENLTFMIYPFLKKNRKSGKILKIWKYFSKKNSIDNFFGSYFCYIISWQMDGLTAFSYITIRYIYIYILAERCLAAAFWLFYLFIIYYYVVLVLFV